MELSISKTCNHKQNQQKPRTSLNHLFAGFVVFVVFIFIISTGFCLEKTSTNSLPAVLKADKVNTNQETNVIDAAGNVELTKNNNHLSSDYLSYDKNSQNINASGNIKIKNYDIGNLIAKEANLKSDFNSGDFFDATIIFNDGSYIKSPQINRISQQETVLISPNFSICPSEEVSENNALVGKQTDIISIKTKETTINKPENSIKNKGVIFRLYDVPILYTPYLKMPIPGSERKSGFLHPSYARSSRLGTGVKIPYYFNIAPDKDLTTTLGAYVIGGNLILNNKYRQLLEQGLYNVELEIANNKPQTNNLIEQQEIKKTIRWKLLSKGNLLLNKDVGLDFDINYLGDKNYLRDYSSQFTGYTTSEVDLNYIKDKDYGSFKTLKIQELEVDRDKRTEPTALPIFNYYTETKPKNSWFGQTYSLLTNSTIITRKIGTQYRRLSLKPEVKIPYNIDGNLFEFASSVQGDLYNINDNKNNAQTNQQGSHTNYRPEASLKWSLPLVTKNNNNTIILEPLATFAVSSYKNGSNKIANEDSNDGELGQSNLFLGDRINGFDRSEKGKRVSYGFRSSLLNDNLGRFHLGLGQSWQGNNQEQDITIKGFNNSNKSNIIGSIGYNAVKIFDINYNFQLNESSYQNDFNEITTNFNFDLIKISTNYILIKESATNKERKEQFNYGFIAFITRKLNFEASATNDLTTKRRIFSRYGINYNNCCLTYGFFISENNPSILSKVERSYNISFTIKNL